MKLLVLGIAVSSAVFLWIVKLMWFGENLGNQIRLRGETEDLEPLPIAENEFIGGKVENEFKADQMLHFDLGGGVSLFAMLWNHNQLRPSRLAMHVPDNCFVGSGMEISQKSKKQIHLELPFAEYREFDTNGRKVYVTYWHFVDGSVIDYERYGNGRTIEYFADNWRGLLGRYQNMAYFRLVSESPFESLEEHEIFESILVEIERIWGEMKRQVS